MRSEIDSLENQILEELARDQKEERMYDAMIAEFKDVTKQEAILKAEVDQLLREVGHDDGVAVLSLSCSYNNGSGVKRSFKRRRYQFSV